VSQRVRAILEIDIGMARTGVQPGQSAVELARRVNDLPGIELVGVMGYEGHLLLVENREEKAAKIRAALAQLVETAEQISAAGMKCKIVSCGGTGSLRFAAQQPGITEIQAGGVIFM